MKKLISGLVFALAISTGIAQNLSVSIEDIDVKDGYFFIAVFNSQEAFDKKETPHKKRISASEINKPVIFKGLPKGEYAVSVFYDTNNNKQLDLKSSGIPNEPFGLSNNPGLGKPRFEKISFPFEKDQHLVIKMRTTKPAN